MAYYDTDKWRHEQGIQSIRYELDNDLNAGATPPGANIGYAAVINDATLTPDQKDRNLTDLLNDRTTADKDSVIVTTSFLFDNLVDKAEYAAVRKDPALKSAWDDFVARGEHDLAGLSYEELKSLVFTRAASPTMANINNFIGGETQSRAQWLWGRDVKVAWVKDARLLPTPLY